MENLTIIIIGIVFGLLISYAGLNRFNTIDTRNRKKY